MSAPPFAVLYVVGMVATVLALMLSSHWRGICRDVATEEGHDVVLFMWLCTLGTALAWPPFWAFTLLWPEAGRS